MRRKEKQFNEGERVLTLSQRDAQVLADALAAPAQPNARLQQAAERFRNGGKERDKPKTQPE